MIDIRITEQGILDHIQDTINIFGYFSIDGLTSKDKYFIYKFLFSENYYAMVGNRLDSICLFLRNIKNSYEVTNMVDRTDYDFYEIVCQTLSHEEIHKSLEILESKYTSCKYDNIYRKIRAFGVMA